MRPIRIASSNAYPAAGTSHDRHSDLQRAGPRGVAGPLHFDRAHMWFNWKLRRTCSHWKRRSRPCMALGEWIQQWLQIVAEIVTEHPNVVTRLLWPCTRCFVDNRTQSHSTPPYKGAWANATKSATTQSSPTPTHPAHNPHPRPAWGDVHSPERSFSRESFATRAPPSRARQQSSPASHQL